MIRRTDITLFLLIGLWLIVIALLAAFQPSAMAMSTVTTILQFSTILALVALGQALVILCGGAGIDLSVGGTMSLTAILAMLGVEAGLPAALLVPGCLLIGGLLGTVNGLVVTRLRVLPLIATLGTFYVYSGSALAITSGANIGNVPAGLTAWGRGLVVGFPLPFLTLALPLFLIVALMLRFTSWGRWVYATGFNERSARLVGIPVDRLRLAAYAGSGVLAGTAALVSLAWLGSARPNIGQNLELTSLTAAMLGGIAIFGGRGGVIGVLAAVLLLVTVQTGLLLVNINSIWQVGIVGALLVAVLLADTLAIARRSS
ncbi:ABC transporter permease [Aureimonas frigidaquae]|uniref:ABC transporter permease n=1 Tax=Aureimonas frigidaquae TaxID=424757 RepID=UPI00078173F1|nr:ABC transporter permease [Aureimonas frigidaquae]